MAKLPSLTGKQLVAALQFLGFEIIRTRGTHNFLRHPDGRATVVPVHSGETIGRGPLARILRDCEITPDDLTSALWPERTSWYGSRDCEVSAHTVRTPSV